MYASLRKGLCIVFCLIASCSISFSQADFSKYEIGLTGGVSIYLGDLTPSKLGSYRTPGWNANLFVNRIINSKLSVRGNLAFIKLRGDDAAYSKPAWRQQRNFNFQSTLWEFSALGQYKVWQQRKLNAYVLGGVGISKINTSRSASNFNDEFFVGEPELSQNLAKDLATGPPTLIPVLPVGAGVEFALSPRISVLVETAYRFTPTDYLDGFSKAANPSRLDHYQTHSAGIKYNFRKKNEVNCPVTF